METLLVASLVAAVVSGAVAWGYELARSYLRRARLEISSCEYHDDGHTRYFYLTVRNFGRTTARACVPQLTIHLKDWDTVRDGSLVNPASIAGHGTAGLNNVATCWQRADHPIEITIHPGQSQRLELASATSHPGQGEGWIFALPTELGYKQRRIVFGGGGFEYIARVGSDNANPVYAFGQVLTAGRHPPTLELSAGPTAAFGWIPPKMTLGRRIWRYLRRPIQLGPPLI